MSERQVDLAKWNGNATGGEVALGLLECRLAMIELEAAFVALSHGDQGGAQIRINNYRLHDGKLKLIIDEIGGF